MTVIKSVSDIKYVKQDSSYLKYDEAVATSSDPNVLTFTNSAKINSSLLNLLTIVEGGTNQFVANDQYSGNMIYVDRICIKIHSNIVSQTVSDITETVAGTLTIPQPNVTGAGEPVVITTSFTDKTIRIGNTANNVTPVTISKPYIKNIPYTFRVIVFHSTKIFTTANDARDFIFGTSMNNIFRHYSYLNKENFNVYQDLIFHLDQINPYVFREININVKKRCKLTDQGVLPQDFFGALFLFGPSYIETDTGSKNLLSNIIYNYNYYFRTYYYDQIGLISKKRKYEINHGAQYRDKIEKDENIETKNEIGQDIHYTESESNSEYEESDIDVNDIDNEIDFRSISSEKNELHETKNNQVTNFKNDNNIKEEIEYLTNEQKLELLMDSDNETTSSSYLLNNNNDTNDYNVELEDEKEEYDEEYHEKLIEEQWNTPRNVTIDQANNQIIINKNGEYHAIKIRDTGTENVNNDVQMEYKVIDPKKLKKFKTNQKNRRKKYIKKLIRDYDDPSDKLFRNYKKKKLRKTFLKISKDIDI